MPETGIAVIGAGYWGKNHVRVFHELGVLRLVIDTDAARRAWVQKRYPDVDVAPTAKDAWGREDVHGVVIATPAATHYRLALEALRAEKDVLIEKPLALNLVEAQHLIDEAQHRNRILMVGHVLEYHPAVQRLYQIVQEGILGNLRYLYSHRLNWGKFRTEENVLWSFAPHDIALMLRIVGALPEDVTAHGQAYLNSDIADVTLTILHFPDKVQGHIFVSWIHPFKEQRFVVVGTEQIAVFDDTRSWEEKLILYPHQIEWRDGCVPIAQKAEAHPVLLEPYEPLQAEAEAFLASIRTRQPPLTDGTTALQVLQILQSAQQSMDKKGTPMKPASTKKRDFFVHPTAIIEEGAEIGMGTKIWHFSHVMSGAKIGKNCVLGQNVFVGRNVKIGNGVKIQNNVSVYEGVELEDYVFCGPSMVFTNVINPRSEIERKDEFRKTLVQRGATLGANSTIVCGVTIGRYAFVGAGAVVTKDVPDYALVVGVPARIVGWMCICGEKLQFTNDAAQCSACGRRYRKEGEQVHLIDEEG